MDGRIRNWEINISLAKITEKLILALMLMEILGSGKLQHIAFPIFSTEKIGLDDTNALMRAGWIASMPQVCVFTHINWMEKICYQMVIGQTDVTEKHIQNGLDLLLEIWEN